MNVALVNQFFAPDVAATAQLLGDLAEDLTGAGFDVRAVTGRGRYVRQPPSPTAQPLSKRVEVVRLPTVPFGRASRTRRLTSYASYFAAASGYLIATEPADVTVCLSTPPLVAAAGVLAQRRGGRFVYKVEDLYPDLAVALGHLKAESLLTRALERASRLLLASADAVVALDESMAARLRGKGARRVVVIPNWADGEAIFPSAAAGARWRQEHAIGDQPLLLYSGNLGLAHCFSGVAEAARRLDGASSNPSWLFVGEGPRLAELRTATVGVESVSFLPYQPRNSLNGLYNAADVHLVTLRDEVAALLAPSKYPAALAAGKPVLLVGGRGSAMAREIEEREVGRVAPDRGDAVAAAVEAMLADRPALERTGRAARRLFEERYSRRACTAQWSELLRELSSRPEDRLS